ncbi:translocation/assembly module TamB domain-containing protein [Nitrosospira lacus]|nr:translocation/assembly module TamB domain-containing protein [Nitrosospira lacus]
MRFAIELGTACVEGLDITALRATEVEIVAPPSAEPRSPPASLELPLALSLRELEIATLLLTHEEGGTPDFKATELAAQLESDGRRHRLPNLRAGLELGGLTASGEIDGIKPFDLAARAELAGRAGFGIAGVELPEMPEAHISAVITGNLEQLRATGTITARNANFEAYGQRLVVERGIVSFQGAIDDPGLNVLAMRMGLPVEAGVEVTSSVRRPRVRLVSTPAVSDLEKLSWITLGRAPEGKADASLLLTAANAILGGQSGGVTDKVAQALGVDDLSIRQTRPMGGDVLAGQIGTVSKRLSNRAYISYEQALTAVAGVTKLTYSLTPKFTVVTRAGIDNAIDVLYTMRFD